jgi:UDP-glucose 4-epimerase
MTKTTSVLITGANGLLGKRLCNKLVGRGFSVHAVTREAPCEQLDGVKYYPIDLSRPWRDSVLPDRVDVVIHLAQSTKFREFPHQAMDIFNVNIESTAKLLNYAKQSSVRQFIYASSGGVYGNGSYAFDENSPISPTGHLGYYLGSKMCGEILVQSYAEILKQVVVIRPFFIYGPGQNRSMLIPRLMDNIVARKTINLQGSNGIRINPVHVDDAAEAVIATLTTKNSATFNIAGPDILSIREICSGMGKILCCEPIYAFEENRANDLVADITAMRSLLCAPKRHLLDSLTDIRFNP